MRHSAAGAGAGGPDEPRTPERRRPP